MKCPKCFRRDNYKICPICDHHIPEERKYIKEGFLRRVASVARVASVGGVETASIKVPTTSRSAVKRSTNWSNPVHARSSMAYSYLFWTISETKLVFCKMAHLTKGNWLICRWLFCVFLIVSGGAWPMSSRAVQHLLSKLLLPLALKVKEPLSFLSESEQYSSHTSLMFGLRASAMASAVNWIKENTRRCTSTVCPLALIIRFLIPFRTKEIACGILQGTSFRISSLSS